MTIKEKLISMLMNNGMFERQANEVLELAMPEINDLVDDYHINMNEPSDSYPDNIYNIIFGLIKPIALKWIEENQPMAWFKPMFK